MEYFTTGIIMGEVHYSMEDLEELQIYIDCKDFEEMLKERYRGVSVLCPRCWMDLPQQDGEYLHCPICGEEING